MLSSQSSESLEQELLRLRQRVAQLEAESPALQFSTIAATIPSVIFQFCIRNGSWTVDYISDRIQDLCGISALEVKQNFTSLIERIHPEDRQGYLASVLKAMEELIPWHYEGRIIKPNGEVRWIRSESSPTQNHDQEVIFCGVLTDITEQKQLELNLHQAKIQLVSKIELQKQQLLQQQQLLQSIIENTNVSIFVKEYKKTNGTYILMNHEFAKRFNVNPDCDRGKTDFDFFTADIAQSFRHNDLQVLAQRNPIQLEEIEPDGDGYRYSIVVKFPLFDPAGDAYAIGGIATDITPLKKAEQLLQQANSELEHRVTERTLELQATIAALQSSETELKQKNQDLNTALKTLRQTQAQLVQSEKMSSLGQLVAGIAHEINNPVNFIHGNIKHASQYVEDLLKLITLYQAHESNSTEEIQTAIAEIDLEFLVQDLPKVFESMYTGTDRIRTIVQSLRTFSRMDEAEFKTVNLHDGIDSTLTILQHRLKAKRGQDCCRPEIQIVRDYGDLPAIACYAGELNQVFLHLLTNAIDTLEHSPNPIIQVQTQLDVDRLLIHIRDNGQGMPESIRQRIFDPFFTTKPVGQGTGMGLSICYQIIVDRHNGTLDCHSVANEGTEFTIALPLKPTSLESH